MKRCLVIFTNQLENSLYLGWELRLCILYQALWVNIYIEFESFELKTHTLSRYDHD